MSNVTPQPAPHNPPAGFYDDPEGSGRKRWFDGSTWSDHYQTAISAVPASPPSAQVAGAATVQTDSRKARDKSQYVRQQKGHSVILEWFVLGIFTFWIRPIYFSVSPNHYWHL